MKVIKNRKKIERILRGSKSLSFIPTMGSLHNGHISLIKKAKRDKNKIIVSIFVNPKQFKNKKDYKSYPRNIYKDLNLLKKHKIDFVFLPSIRDIYSYKAKNNIYLDKFSKSLCGKYRPGHFKGVINVVNRFVEIINPKKIYLGKKDFQQLILIKKHFSKNNIKIKIIECNTLRDTFGLAESSRNKSLNDNQLNIARTVSKILKKNKIIIKRNFSNYNLNNLKSQIISLGLSKVEYLKLLNLKTLKYPKINENFNIFIAYYLGKTRLIDNV